MHGFALTKSIDRCTSGDLGIVDSAFYRALSRLEDAGAAHAEWGRVRDNPCANYYSLTAKGRKRRRAEVASWRHYVATVNILIEPG